MKHEVWCPGGPEARGPYRQADGADEVTEVYALLLSAICHGEEGEREAARRIARELEQPCTADGWRATLLSHELEIRGWTVTAKEPG